jgi:LmbE family N-acetylglucosaminyl deacetylase
VGTLVCFHAHPDDESIGTGGVMARAADEGHRVILVVATCGEHGEVEPGFLADGETLGERRVTETRASAEVLGASRVEFLGYVDSGMMGTPENDLPGSFWQADVEEAAGRLARILEEESADVLTVYDDHGVYGHPDHIQVHRVGVRAAELAGTPRVFESTMHREHMIEGLQLAQREGHWPDDSPIDVPEDFGSPEAIITHGVDVTAWLDRKRSSMRAHASQIGEQSFFLAMPDDMFAVAFGTEWFIDRSGTRGEWLLSP